MAAGEVRPADGRLAGKVAIVTGGATGIGEAICHRFVREGARVTVAGLPDGGIAVAKGGVGGQVPDELQRQPEGELELSHSHDGRAG